MEGLDYLPAAFDGINKFYVRSEDKALLPSFAATANVLDNFLPHEIVRLIRKLVMERDAALAVLGMTPPSPEKSRRLASRIRSAVRRLGRRAG